MMEICEVEYHTFQHALLPIPQNMNPLKHLKYPPHRNVLRWFSFLVWQAFSTLFQLFSHFSFCQRIYQPTFRTEHLTSMILNNYLIQKEKPINIIYNIKDKILHDTFCKLAVRLNKYHKSSVDHLFTFYQSIYFSTRYKMPIASLEGAEGGIQVNKGVSNPHPSESMRGDLGENSCHIGLKQGIKSVA